MEVLNVTSQLNKVALRVECQIWQEGLCGRPLQDRFSGGVSTQLEYR